MRPSELKDLAAEELLLKERELREELTRLRLRKGVNPLENPMKPRHVRRDLARVLTVLGGLEKARKRG